VPIFPLSKSYDANYNGKEGAADIPAGGNRFLHAALASLSRSPGNLSANLGILGFVWAFRGPGTCDLEAYVVLRTSGLLLARRWFVDLEANLPSKKTLGSGNVDVGGWLFVASRSHSMETYVSSNGHSNCEA
jgi:hypothetical protein